MTIKHQPPKCLTRHGLSEFAGPIEDLFRDLIARPGKAIASNKAVLLYGPEGTGKSSAVGRFAQELISQKRLIFWLNCRDFPADFRDADVVVDRLKDPGVKVVIIDDLGKEPANVREKLGKILAARYVMGHGLDIYTTNLAVSEDVETCKLTEFYGRSIRSRIFERCGAHVINFLGPDRRL